MVAKVCSRSHGQPVFGVRSAAMISRRRSMSREGVMIDSRLKRELPDGVGGRDYVGGAVNQRRSVTGLVDFAAGLEREPYASLGLVNEVFEEARRGHILVI